MEQVQTGLASVIDFNQYNSEELLQLDEELLKKVNFLKVEVELFESYWSKLRNASGKLKNGNLSTSESNSDSANPKFDSTKGAEGADADSAPTDETGFSGVNKRRQKGDKNRDNVVLSLNSEQKVNIATREIDEMKEEIDTLKEQSQKTIEILKAEIEEATICTQELKKELHDFNTTVVQDGVHPRTKKIASEKVVRYFEDNIRHKEAFIEKYRLENGTLRTQRRNLQAQLKQKEEIGEVLHAIDFDQLQIENKQFIAKIEERNMEVLGLKRIAARTVQNLNDYKIILAKETARSKSVKNELAQRRDILAKLSVEEKSVASEKHLAKGELDTMKSMMDQIKVPDVIDYVSLKAKQMELAKQAKSWDRKCQIAAVQLKRAQKVVSEIMKQVSPDTVTGNALSLNIGTLEKNKHNQDLANERTIKLVGSKHQKQFAGLEKLKPQTDLETQIDMN